MSVKPERQPVRQRHNDRTGTRANVFYQSAIERLKDAKTLLADGRYHGSSYIAGYVIEFYIKYIICVRNSINYLEDLNEVGDDGSASGTGARFNFRGNAGHSLEHLVKIAHLDILISKDRELRKAFAVVNSWNVSWRYLPELGSKDYAERFIEAVETLKTWFAIEAMR